MDFDLWSYSKKPDMSAKTLSVSQINYYIGQLLEGDSITGSCCVTGEVFGFKHYQPSGHMYFTLKDENSALSCVMFKNQNRLLKIKLHDGMKVLVYGKISVFSPQGRYQLYANQVEPMGQGELLAYLEDLKNHLHQQGYFDADKKKALPVLANKVGIVTSKESAAFRDMLKIIRERYSQAEVILAHAAVQGSEAHREIANAIRMLNEQGQAEVIIVGRGGGSMEDLMAFNHEEVVKAIYNSVIPIISAVGHEVDFTLADLAADVRAATPTQAGQLASPDIKRITAEITNCNKRMIAGMERKLAVGSQLLDRIRSRRVWQAPQAIFEPFTYMVNRAKHRLVFHMEKNHMKLHNRFLLQLSKLDSLNPLRVMERGFALVEKEGFIVTSVEGIKANDLLLLKLTDGDLQVRVENRKKVVRW